MSDVTISAQVDAAVAADLDRLAAFTHRPVGALVAEAVESFLAREDAFIAAVEEGKRAALDGRVVPHAEVVALVDRLLHG